MVSSVLTSGSAFFCFVFVLLIVAEESIGKRKDQEKKKERGKKGKSASATVTNVSGVSNQPREPSGSSARASALAFDLAEARRLKWEGEKERSQEERDGKN
jgi:hypothetical protein